MSQRRIIPSEYIDIYLYILQPWLKYVGFETINFVFTQTSCLVISFCILLCFYTRDGYLIVVLVHPRGEYCMLTFLQVERLQLYSKRRVTRRALGRKREIFFLESRQLRIVSSCLRHITIVLNPSLRKTVKKREMHTLYSDDTSSDSAHSNNSVLIFF